MANEEQKPAGAATNGNGTKAALNVLAQYVKDLSFESPGAPNSLRGRDKAPGIAINVNVNANPMSEKEFDVNLTLTAKASFEKDVLFNVELVYGGVFRLKNVPENQLSQLLMIECPRLIFPFARQVLASVTQQGGFPPLMMEPVDFNAIYLQNLKSLQAQQAAGGTTGSAPGGAAPTPSVTN